MPSAVQGRLGGAKGMFLLTNDPQANTEDAPMVWIRPSQNKISYGGPSYIEKDISRLTLDTLRVSKTKMPGHLSKETVTCFAHGGVSYDVFRDLFRKSLEELFGGLSNWDGPSALVRLWLAVFDADHVLMSRLRHEAGGSARAFGVTSESGEESSDPEAMPNLNGKDTNSESPVVAPTEPLSEMPQSWAEQILLFLAAGFSPKDNPILGSKLKLFIETILTEHINKYRVAIPNSLEGFAVPDPTDALEEGEIFFQSSETWENQDGSLTSILLGPVVATRHPCKVPSDIQKFVAVDKEALRDYHDVIIFSRKGMRSPLSLLGGGDYDGDTVTVIFEPSIVSRFNPEPLRSDGTCSGDSPEGFIERNFSKASEVIEDFLRARNLSPDCEEAQKKYQEVLLSALELDSLVGRYSGMHEKCCYQLGYNHPESIRLAHMFCNALDGHKGGITPKRDVFQNDVQKYDKYDLPRSHGGAVQSTAYPSRLKAKRPASLGEDIVDRLYNFGLKLQSDFMKTIPQPRRVYDEGLASEYKEFVQHIQDARNSGDPNDGIHATMATEDLDAIKRPVEDSHREYLERVHRGRLTSAERSEAVRQISTELGARLSMIQPRTCLKSCVFRVAASYCYVFDIEHHSMGTPFPFETMFKELANLKNAKKGGAFIVSNPFADKMVVHRSLVPST